jgi:ATP-dependent Clp protease protease subunit
MNRATLPRIRLEAKPPGLKFRPPASAVARFDKSKSVHAAAKVDGEIEILGEIGDSGWGMEFTTAKMVKDQLKAIGKAPVLVTINSPGGDAFEGIAIYNLLREHGAKVTVSVLGLAASAASIIAMAGDTIKMGEGAFLMIHSSSGLVMGNQADMREFADLLQSIDSSVAKLYAARTGKPEAEMIAMMQKETWLTADEAVKSGFADVAVPGDKKKAKAATDSAVSASVPLALLAASGAMQRPVVRLNASPPGASGKPAARRPGVVYLNPPKEPSK